MNKITLRSIFVTMFAAIISVGCFIAIPVGPGGIPIVMQNMLAVLSGCLLGIQGAVSVGLFLVSGALGLPVFSGGRGGFAVLAGPTGGFLWGYFFGALTAGFIAGIPVQSKKCSFTQTIRLVFSAASGFAAIYVPGAMWFMHLNGTSLKATLIACVVPFIPGDIIKIVLTVFVAIKLRPAVSIYLYADD